MILAQNYSLLLRQPLEEYMNCEKQCTNRTNERI